MGETRNASVGSLKKGSTCVIDGAACTVTDLKVSRPGKHGHAKVNLTGVGIIDGVKRNIMMPGHDTIQIPVIDKRNAQVLSITGTTANVMDSESYETFDIEIPEELRSSVKEGSTILYWIVLDDKVIKQVKD